MVAVTSVVLTIAVTVLCIGAVQKLCHERRGEYHGMHYLDPTRVEFVYELPLAEIWTRMLTPAALPPPSAWNRIRRMSWPSPSISPAARSFGKPKP